MGINMTESVNCRKLHFTDYSETSDYYMADLSLSDFSKAPEHYHDFYEIFVVISGEFCETVDNEKRILEKDTVRLVNPDTVHSLDITGRYQQNQLRNIAFRPSAIPVEIDKKIFCDYATISDYPDIATLIKKTEYIDKLPHHSELRTLAFRNLLEDILLTASLKSLYNQAVPLWLCEAHKAMQLPENYLKGVSYCINQSGMTHSHFTREFTKYYNITPVGFINYQKLFASAVLLRTTDSKIINIALECGFENVSNYNRQFLKCYGITPSLYRKRNNGVFR